MHNLRAVIAARELCNFPKEGDFIKVFFSSILSFFKSFIHDIFKVLRKNLNSEDWNDVIFLTIYLLFIFAIISIFIYLISSCTLDISHLYIS